MRFTIGERVSALLPRDKYKIAVTLEHGDADLDTYTSKMFDPQPLLKIKNVIRALKAGSDASVTFWGEWMRVACEVVRCHGGEATDVLAAVEDLVDADVVYLGLRAKPYAITLTYFDENSDEYEVLVDD